VFDSILLFFLLGAGTGAVYVLAAQGLVLIHRGSGVVNFANGGFALIGAYTFFELQESGIPEVPAIAIGMLAAAAAGAATHLLIMRRLKNAAQLTRVIATLALLALIQGAFIVKFQSDQAFPHFPLPNPTEHIFGQAIGAYYLFMLLIAAVLSAGLWAFYRYSAFGLKTSASAENGRSMAALGHSPDRLATWNWSAGGALAGLGGILVAPIVGLSVESVGLLLVPMLASALLGSFSSFSLTFLGGLVVGVGEAEVQRSVTTPGWPEVVPFFIVILVLVLKGSSLPSRSYVSLRLPKVGSGNIPWRFAIPGFAGGVALCLLLSNGASAALIDTITAAIILLSSVVVTGYAGQLSLAQLGIAGIGAFIAARVGQAIGLNFWEALIVGMIGVIPIGIIIGLPALRARGVNLAIVTLGFGVIVEQVIFANSTFTGGVAGTTVQTPTLFGFDLNAELHPQRYAVLSLVLFALSGLAVCNLRRGRVGRRLVAVRGNERAAATLGINVAQTKLYAFSVAGVLATVGGVLIVYQASSVTWTSGWDVITGITLLSTIVIGGIGFVGGSLIGGLVVAAGISAYLFSFLGVSVQNWIAPVAGLGTILVILKWPDGIVAMITGGRRARRATKHADAQQKAAAASLAGFNARADALSMEAVVRDGHELTIEGLTVRFGGVVALDDVSFSVRSGEVVGLIGPNGAGKTTLIDAVTGITRRYTGHISVDGRRLDGQGPTQRARTGLARSFQSLELFDDLSVEENIAVAAESPPAWAYVSDLVWPLRGELGASAISAIKEFGLAGDLTKHPGELPFGRRRLVGIVRAIAAAPKIVLLDEPAAGLDQRESAELVDLLRHLAEDWNLGILLVEHDMRLVMSVCDRITALDFGQVIAQGSPDEVRNSEAVVTAYLGIGGAEGNARTSRQSVAEVPESTPI
jgi:sulfate-transporting ATPase